MEKKDYFCSPMRIVKTLAGSGKLIYNVCFCSRKHNAIAMLKHISTYRSEKEQDRSAHENRTPGKAPPKHIPSILACLARILLRRK